MISWRPMVKLQHIGALGKFDNDGVVGSLGGIVFGQLSSEAAGLHTDGRIGLWIEVRPSTKYLGGNLIFL